jgi:hypothetical protein
MSASDYWFDKEEDREREVMLVRALHEEGFSVPLIAMRAGISEELVQGILETVPV